MGTDRRKKKLETTPFPAITLLSYIPPPHFPFLCTPAAQANLNGLQSHRGEGGSDILKYAFSV